MSQTVAPQVDVGSVTLQGLAAFTPILAAPPPTMFILWPYNKYRSASQRLEGLGAVLGWRKGDVASFLARVPGGQAIALLCMCLLNMFSQGKVGEILHILGKRLLSPDASLSSRAQLVHAAEVASSKLAAIGFGNELARQLVLIHDV
ncbi:hypothetical protein B0J14DRAFT_657072 [Halenospora varia]|nr:hypothetical protein B0J14DRAFT_657072 [Halenospora varia]